MFPARQGIDRRIIRGLLTFGALIVLAQLADYLYAPADNILINKLIGADAVAVYAPLLQIDSALLVLVAGLAAVILPRSALAHAAGQRQLVLSYYLRGTLASLALLTAAGALVWLISPWLFRAWLGNPMTASRAILPLVLVHTIVGGSSAVGRAILLGARKAKPFAISALIAGGANIVLALLFVRYLHLGLRGIVLATIIAVVARSAVWMPWYVMRSLPDVMSVEALPAPAYPE